MRIYLDIPNFDENYEDLIPYMVNGNPSGLIAAIIEDIDILRDNVFGFIKGNYSIEAPRMVDYIIRASTDHNLPRLDSRAIKVISSICYEIFSTVFSRISRNQDWYNHAYSLESFSYGNVRSYGAISLLLCGTPISSHSPELQSRINLVAKDIMKAMFGRS